MLRWRLLLGTLIVAALIGLCWLDGAAAWPGVWLMPLAVVAALLGTKEVLDLAARAGMKPLRGTIYLGNLVLVGSCWLATRQDPYTTLVAMSCFAAGLVAYGEMIRYRRPGRNMANIAAGLFAVLYVGVTLAFAVQMRVVWGIGALASWVIVVKMGDTGAYTVGRLIGRHKLAPAISPGKTIEGAFGAVAFSLLGAWASLAWLVPATTRETSHQTPWWGWIVFGLVVGIAGMLGDLFESVLKRDVGVKDSSTWMPGFGGVLDILDSLLLSAPVAWFCWAFGIVGR
jgi:phosphatidate cytidylyltransferase